LTWLLSGAAAVVALVVLDAVFSTSPAKNTSSSGTSYDIGSPGIGKTAPAFTLAASTGKQVSLNDYRGKNVLLYFQEGLTCQPCWDQLTDLEKSSAQVKAARIDAVVSVTTDPADLITRKTKDMGLTTPVLSDPDLAVSKTYDANSYGMMGTSRDGHTFILVGPDGTIRWRADYGGAPDYTMYVTVNKLLADLKAGART
jgi:peroxiredoxin Q/BCP